VFGRDCHVVDDGEFIFGVDKLEKVVTQVKHAWGAPAYTQGQVVGL
jgi:hypothetical protein